MTARFLVGDVFERLAELPDRSVDLVLCSPPFLALRSYLPDGHPDKAKEIGSEATPAEYLDVLLRVTAQWRRLLAGHGSIAVELGDTYAGSGGAGGDYSPGGLREAQQPYTGSASAKRITRKYGRVQQAGLPPIINRNGKAQCGGDGWPLDKSLCLIPGLFAACLAYGRNVLTGQASPAGFWRVRTVKSWIRTNPPVGALGDKERPATSYIIVATIERDRWFDLDSVRVPPLDNQARRTNGPKLRHADGSEVQTANYAARVPANPSGGPPADWWHEVDAVLDAALRESGSGSSHARTARGVDRRATTGKPAAQERGGGWASLDTIHSGASSGVRGWHLRRALERAGILSSLEALDVSPGGYSGAHYAVWPPELVRLLLDEMCPRRACSHCGQPSRRLGDTTRRAAAGWTSCGCPGTDGLRADGFHTGPGWRPGAVLDPFAGSGTSGAVATGMGRDCVLIDIDESNVRLAEERVGMFLDSDHDTNAVPENRTEARQ